MTDELARARSATMQLRELVRTRRVLITVGAGGVGKTTTAAALAIAAAREGRHVLCLTIDPARRLAESLGLGTMSSEAQLVDPSRFAAAGLKVTGSVTAMMLDTKRTFDEFVLKHAKSRESADRLLGNRLYRYVSGSLAGTQEYMAMEKLVAVKEDPRYDLVVLDTPPTANALDFLDAPQRLMGALDSAAMRWFVEAFQDSGKFSLNILAKGAQTVLKGLGKITGGGFLQALSEFTAELNELFGGFRERALAVEKALRSPDVSFVLVTSPSPSSIDEVLFFADRLRASDMPRGAFIVNRQRVSPVLAELDAELAAAKLGGAAPGAIARDLAQLEPAFTAHVATQLLAARAAQHQLAQHDAKQVERLRKFAGMDAALVCVPEFATDVHNVKQLAELGEKLVGQLPVR